MKYQKLPKHLTGPFTLALYSRRDGIIYLRRPNGEMTSTRAYPSFFLKREDRKKFPGEEFAKSIIEWIDEGDFFRAVMEPNIKREVIHEMMDTAWEVGIQLLEADVSPVRRWFSDTGALVSQKYRSLFFDLETDPLLKGFDNDAKKKHRIISWAAYDQEGNSWFRAADKSTNEQEVKVIKDFLEVAKDYDVLLAWNGDDYDFFVLRERCKLHKIRVDWRRWNSLDYMLVVKKLLGSISDPMFKRSFALDNIGKNVLGIEKIKTSVKGGELKKLLGPRVGELEAYNRRDVEIMLGIEKKREFLVLQYALCSLCRLMPNRGSVFPNSIADGMLLRLAIQEGKHFPSKRFSDTMEEPKKYEGGFVLQPELGFHTNVQVPDFASLYPSIMISWNMSNDTKIIDGEDYPPHVASDHAVATATGQRFRTDFEGIIPKALKQLLTKRKEYKVRAKGLDIGSEEYTNVTHLSTAVKVVANSIYGLLGSPYSRYYDREIARSVTLTGQLLIQEHARFFRRKGFQVVAGDTDSVFIKCHPEEMNEVLPEINNHFIPSILEKSGCKECLVSMDFDKGYRSLLIVTKKRYAGKLSIRKGREADNELEIKGLEFQRSDNAVYTQQLQKKYIDLLLEPDTDPDLIDSMLRKDGQDFYKREFPLEEIVITKGCSKHPDDYNPKTTAAKVATYLIESGQEFFVGMKIPFVVVGHKPNISAIHADDYTGRLDREYYWQKLTLKPILRLINARFPNYMFSDFKQPMQLQFDFSNQRFASRKVPKKVTTQKIIKKKKKIKRAVKEIKSEIYTLTIPSHAGVPAIKGIGKLCRSFPGKYKLAVVIDIKSLSAEVDISTEQYVSMDCLKQIQSLFPKVKIEPKPI